MYSAIEPVTLWSEVEDLGRRRLQQQGDLEQRGGWWMLRWREPVMKEDGSIGQGRSPRVRIGPCEGPRKLTEKEARRIAWDDHLSKLDQNVTTPQSMMTVAYFVEHHFYPEHILVQKSNTKIFYRSRLKDVLKPDTVNRIYGRPTSAEFAERTGARVEVKGWPYVDEVRLRDFDQPHVQRLVTAMIRREVAPATVKHIKTVCSAIIKHAKACGFYKGANPASDVKTPELEAVKELHSLSLDQLELVLSKLKYPTRQMCQLATLSSMNIAEINGLQWKRVNLSDRVAVVDGEAIPPRTLLVRKQWNLGKLETPKRKKRKRSIPLTPGILTMLSEVKQRDQFTGPDDYVFVSRKGTPVDTHNLANRELREVGTELGMPWLSWHVFRRTNTTLLEEDEVEVADRQAIMGHANAQQTEHYTVRGLDRRREQLGRLSRKVFRADELSGPIQ